MRKCCKCCVRKKSLFLRWLDLKETWRHLSRNECSVRTISFTGRKDLRGTLSQSFKELKDLGFLDLSDTKISGDLAVLANCTKMTHLFLPNTLVTGNLAALAKARHYLRLLDLGDTKISGDLAVLANCTKMNHLDLRNTMVSGNLGSLADATIRVLDLSNSKVTGNLGALSGGEVGWVRLSNTTIAGDVAALGTWPKIREVDLSYSEVTGTFRVNSVLEELEILKLTGTRTKIDFMGVHRESYECPFRPLTTLEVSGLAMDASVSEFLAPLLNCRHLNSIGAAGCGLTREVPKTAVFLRREYPFDVTPLGKVLVFLDLASNRIGKVKSIPKRLKTLVLAGNTNMSFAEGVLQKAVQDGILLDVQNVTFTNQTDARRCMAWFDCKMMWTAVKG